MKGLLVSWLPPPCPAPSGGLDYDLSTKLDEPKMKSLLMVRHFLASVILTAVFVAGMLCLPAQAQTDAGQTVDPAIVRAVLEGQFKNKVVTLRRFNQRNDLKYDIEGALLSRRQPGDWTLYSRIEIQGVKVNNRRIQFNGRRLWAHYKEQTKEWEDIRAPFVVRLQIRLGEGGLDAPWDEALRVIFLTEEETLADFVPPAWQPFLRGIAPDPDEALKSADLFEEESKEQKRKSPFRLKKSKRLPFPREAATAKVAGKLVVLFYIGYDGRLESPMILQPV